MKALVQNNLAKIMRAAVPQEAGTARAADGKWRESTGKGWAL